MRQTIWKTVTFVVGIPLAYLVIWTILLILAHAFGFSISDAGSLLSVLGSIMGAIFAVGGLVVALVAILTQIQLRDRVEQVVDDAKQAVVNKFEQELRGEYERQIKQQVEGMLAFFQATNSRDWKQAEKLVTEALQKYPDLPGARSFLGLHVGYEVINSFYMLFLVSFQFLTENVGGPVTPMHNSQFASEKPAPPKLEAIHWLKEAQRHQDDPEGQVTAMLALMYGYSDAYDLMLDTIQKALAVNPSLLSFFQRPDKLMMLIYACHSLASIEEVMRTVDLKLPRIDEVQHALTEESDPKKNPYVFAKPYMEWYAVELRTDSSSWMPAKVLIAFPNKNGLTYAQVSKPGQLTITIPPQMSSVIDTEKLLSVDEILKQLTDKGIVLITRMERL